MQVWSSSYLPISTSSVFDRFGQTYNTSAVVDTARMALDDEAYKAYSPLYLPMTYATTYGLAFMLSTSIIVHTTIYHGKDIMARVRALKADDDIHMRLMKAYPEVPDWWYMVFLLISVGMSIATVAVSSASEDANGAQLTLTPDAGMGHANARLVSHRLAPHRLHLHLARRVHLRHDQYPGASSTCSRGGSAR